MKCVTKFDMVHCHNVLQLRTEFQGGESIINMLNPLLKLTMYRYVLRYGKTDLAKSLYRTALVLKVLHHEMSDEIWYGALLLCPTTAYQRSR